MAWLLQHHPDPLAQLPGLRVGVQAQHADLARVGLELPGQEAQGGGLAGPVGPQETKDLPHRNGEAQGLHGPEGAKGTPDVLDGQGEG